MIERAIKHIAAFRKWPSQRLLDTCYGPQAKPLRTQVAALFLDRKVTGSDKAAQWGNFRVMLLRAAGIDLSAGCIAAQDSQFEQIAASVIGDCVTN